MPGPRSVVVYGERAATARDPGLEEGIDELEPAPGSSHLAKVE
jgi:hypothetical protein